MTKVLTLKENSKKQSDNKNATKYFDYTTITDQLGTISWSNVNHSTDVVKLV